MKYFSPLITSLLWVLSVVAGGPLAAQDGTDPLQIILNLEKKMYVSGRAEMVMTHTDKNGIKDDFSFIAYAKDNNQKIILRVLAPARMMGNDMLFQERNVWVFDKKAGREMKIPANQSFGGTGFSYGDVLRLNYSSNFLPKITQTLDDGWILELSAKERDAPYFRVTLEIARDFSPRKGTCWSRTGEVVKEMVWSQVRDAGTGPKPQTLTVTSPLDPGEVSVLTIMQETRRDYPDHIYNRRNLSARLEEKL